MTDISVRGEARHVVPPDFAVVRAVIDVHEQDKDAALDRAGRAQHAVLEALRQQGGTALTVESMDAPLTWSTRSLRATREYDWDQHKSRRPAGWQVQVPVTVTVRELGRIAQVSAALTSADDLNLQHVSWGVDPRNAAWPVVRTAAIADATAKARDYARALDASVTALSHLADEGLLGNRAELHHRTFGLGSPASSVHESGDGGPALDPVPQEITAVVEARFEASVAAL